MAAAVKPHVGQGHVIWALAVLRYISIDYYTTAELLAVLAGLFMDVRDKVAVITMFYARILDR